MPRERGNNNGSTIPRLIIASRTLASGRLRCEGYPWLPICDGRKRRIRRKEAVCFVSARLESVRSSSIVLASTIYTKATTTTTTPTATKPTKQDDITARPPSTVDRPSERSIDPTARNRNARRGEDIE